MSRFFKPRPPLMLIFLLVLTAFASGDQKNVFFLHTWPASYPWTISMDEGIQEALSARNDWVFFSESLGSPILNDSLSEQEWYQYLSRKYASIHFDMVLCEGDQAGNFIGKYGQILFGETLKIVYASQEFIRPDDNTYNLVTQEESAILDTVAMAMRQNPNHKRVVIIDNNADANRKVIESIRRQAQEDDRQVIEYTDFSMAELRTWVSQLKGDEIVFFFAIRTDNTGASLVPRVVLTELAKLSPSPIYTFWSSLLGSGCVGGVMVDSKKIALEMFKIADLFQRTGSFDTQYTTNQTFVDWEAAKRYSLDVKDDDPDTVYINKAPSFLESHFRETMLASLSILALFLSVSLYSRQRTVKAHAELMKIKEQLERAQHVANLGFWEYAFPTKRSTWADEIFTILQLDPRKVQPSIEVFYSLVHPDDLEMVRAKFLESTHSHHSVVAVHRVLLKDGTIKWLEEQFNTIFDEKGRPSKSFGTAYDITRQKETELRFKSLLDNASDGIHVVDEEGTLVLYSKSFANNLGYAYDEVKGMHVSEWDAGIPKDQIKTVLKDVLQSRQTFETKHRRKDGRIIDVQISVTDILLDNKLHLYASQRDITLHKQHLEQLNRLNEMLNTASEVAKIGFWELEDAPTYAMTWNRGVYDIFEIDDKASEIDFDRFLSFLPNEERDHLQEVFVASLQTKSEYHIIHRVITAKGNHRIVEERARHVFDPEGKLVKSIGSVLDITEQQEKELLINAKKKELETIFETSLQGIALLKLDTSFVYVNKKFADILEESVDALLSEKYSLLHDPEMHGELEAVLKTVIEKGRFENYACFVTTKSGKTKQLKASIALMPDQQHFLLTAEDSTELYTAMEYIKRQARTDELTKLGNRKAFNERMDELIAQYRRYDLAFTMLMLDIDHFKSINDTYGHQKGDDVLVALSKVVSDLVRKNDYFYRVGGEEFVLLLSGTHLEKAILFAERVRTTIQERITFIENRQITVSIGAAEMREDDTADTLFSRADDGLYRAKRAGRNRVEQ